jgi:hypothetical protein
VTTPVKNRPSGTKPVPAKPARDPRVLTSAFFAPVFLMGAGLLAWWASDSGPDGSTSLGLLAGVCAVLFVVTAARVALLLHRARRPAESDEAGPPESR